MSKETRPRYESRLNILGCFALLHAVRSGTPLKPDRRFVEVENPEPLFMTCKRSVTSRHWGDVWMSETQEVSGREQRRREDIWKTVAASGVGIGNLTLLTRFGTFMVPVEWQSFRRLVELSKPCKVLTSATRPSDLLLTWPCCTGQWASLPKPNRSSSKRSKFDKEFWGQSIRIVS
jgi:hypothetical protein